MRDDMEPAASGRETGPGVLAVDLDGTLIRSDMLDESFWAAFARDWRTPVRALAALAGGKAALKERLRRLGMPDPAALPYRPEVLEFIAHWRARGGTVVLATAADRGAAQAVADHLGLFDAVHASDGTRNLRGAAKAEALVAAYGARGFTYLGDSGADVPVWAQARAAVTVAAPASVRMRAQAVNPEVTHLAPRGGWLQPALRAMRPHQWLKNVLIFLPAMAAHQFDGATLAAAVLAFLAFSLTASSVYLLNDLMDLAADRAHPRKRHRPLASGALPIRRGMALVPVLLLAGMGLGAALGPAFAGVLAGYYALTVAYSLSLKRKALVDLAALATLYALRVVAGAVACGIVLSVWLVAFSVFLFFALAAVKRQAELVDLNARGQMRAAGRGYGTEDLPVVTQMAIASGFVAVLVLMLYLTDPEVMARYAHPELLWGVALVTLYWVARTVLLAARGQMSDDPVVFAARDRVSLLCAAAVAALVLAAIRW
jgi:4-hydroxybenzoate polyprenyltransferase/phosphoserine phosphatase